MNNRKGMIRVSAALVALGLPLAAFAETRQIDAHQHGTTEIEMAIEAGAVAMALHAPGADIVGFEHSPESEADKSAVAAAIGLLSRPQELFAFPDAAGCGVVSATVALKGDEADGHGHSHSHGHAQEHLEFAATYEFACSDTSAITGLELPYFTAFPGAQKIAFSIVSDAGARADAVTRDDAALTLGGGS